MIARSAPDAIFVRLDSAVLVEAPSFEVRNWPDLDPVSMGNSNYQFLRDKSSDDWSGTACPRRTRKNSRSDAPRRENKTRSGCGTRTSRLRKRNPLKPFHRLKKQKKASPVWKKDRGLEEPEMKQEKGSVGAAPGAKQKRKGHQTRAAADLNPKNVKLHRVRLR